MLACKCVCVFFSKRYPLNVIGMLLVIGIAVIDVRPLIVLAVGLEPMPMKRDALAVGLDPPATWAHVQRRGGRRGAWAPAEGG